MESTLSSSSNEPDRFLIGTGLLNLVRLDLLDRSEDLSDAHVLTSEVSLHALEADWAEAGVNRFRVSERHATVAAVTFVEDTDLATKRHRVLDGCDQPAEDGDKTCIVLVGRVEVTRYPEPDLRLVGEDHASVTVALNAILKDAELNVVSGQLDLAILLVALLLDAGGEVSACNVVAERQHCTAGQSKGSQGHGIEVRAGCCVIVSHVASC